MEVILAMPKDPELVSRPMPLMRWRSQVLYILVSDCPAHGVAASDRVSGSQGLPVWVAGLSAVGGAAVTLLVQVISGHN